MPRQQHGASDAKRSEPMSALLRLISAHEKADSCPTATLSLDGVISAIDLQFRIVTELRNRNQRMAIHLAA